MKTERIETNEDSPEYQNATKMHDDGVSRYYKITARNEGQLNMLEEVFTYMQGLGAVGASRQLTIFCDGDGAVQLKFKRHCEDEYIFQDLLPDEVNKQNLGYGRYTINDDDGEGKETYFDLG
ncbi:MAG: hypothetical protein IJH63_00645 [Methanobrevibacter sp.]|nr:hypothetical protein [Methanosphaera sp.]MBR0369212.1 hypothetical protein [Methanobrevibacter sp.]